MQCTLPFVGFADPVALNGAPVGGAGAESGAKRRKGKQASAKGGQKVAEGRTELAEDRTELATDRTVTAAALIEMMAAPAVAPVVTLASEASISIATSIEVAIGAPTQAAAVAAPAPAPAPAPIVALVTEVPAAVAPAAQALDSMRVVVFDVETTGTDRRNDQVIELGVQLGLGEDAEHRTWRFRPDVPIHPGAQAVHGISMEDLEGCPSFRDCVDEIAALFERVEVIIGYNIAFDIDMLQAEYERAGKRPLDFSGKTIVDAFRLWQQCEPRSLQHAHQRFVGDRFTAAHSASADVAATGRVLTGMLRAFGLEQQDWGAIAGLCDPQRATWIGPTRHLRWEAGVVVMGFGKHAGSALHKIAHGPDRSFLRWVLDKDFPPHVGEICRAALELAARAHEADAAAEPTAAWVRERFGGPPAAQAAPVVAMSAAASAG